MLTGFHLYLASGWNLKKKKKRERNLNKIGESFPATQMDV